MKRLLLSFVTVFVLIPCVAQQTPSSTNLRPLTPCPPFGTIDPVSQVICIGSKVVFTAAVSYFQTYGSWQMSNDGGMTWQPSIGNPTYSPYQDILTIPVVSESMNGYMFRCVYDSICEDIVITNFAVLTVSNIPLSITSQPANVTVCKNYPADFTVSALGSSLIYQWQISTTGGSSFINIPGKTTSFLHFDSVFVAMNNYRYRCIITSECSPTVTSDIALLTVKDEAVKIITQPVNQFACLGDSAMFKISVSGNNPGYQWQQWRSQFGSYENIAGENDSALIAVAEERLVYYRCIVTSSCKTLNSYDAYLKYVDPPTMTAAETKYVCSGQQAYLTYGYAGYLQDNLYSYQWQVSRDSGATFSNITAGGNGGALPLTANDSINNFIYRCRVNNSCFDSYSNFKLLKAGIPVSITSQPQNKNACAGFPVSFSVKTIGSVSQYHWQESGDGGITFTDLPPGYEGIADTTLKIRFAVPSQNNYQYRCKIFSNCSFDTIYSSAAVLHVLIPPLAPNDTSTEVLCDSCKINISGLFNTSGFTTAAWENIDSSNVSAGKHKLIVYNTSGCFDSAYAYVNVHDADTLRICWRAATHFHCNISGSGYQWQINTGSGFTDVSDDNVITGSVTQDISLLATSTMQIRCKVDNVNYSNAIFVKETAYWTGNSDSDWYNPLNWSCGEIPTYYNTDVIILNNTPHTPQLTKDAACKKLILKPGATIIIQPGIGLYITGSN